jgi:hypothetical protein
VDRAAEACARSSAQPGSGRTNAWLELLVSLALGNADVAEKSAERCLGRPLTEAERSDPNLWLRIWDHIPTGLGVYPAHYYPRLPPALTGLPHELVRLPHLPSPLTDFTLGLARVPFAESARRPDVPAAAAVPEPRDDDLRGVTIVNQVSPLFGPIYPHSEVTVSDVYNVNQAAAVGRNASAHNAVFQQIVPATQLPDLARELDTLLQSLAPASSSPSQQEEVAAITSAMESARNGDADGVRSSLASAGKWALGVATAIGTALAAAAIKSAAGF